MGRWESSEGTETLGLALMSCTIRDSRVEREDRNRRTGEQWLWILFFSPWGFPELIRISHLPSDLGVPIRVPNTDIRKERILVKLVVMKKVD